MRTVFRSLDSVWQLYRLEIRSALRERTIIVNSIVMPVLLYPFMLWAAFTGVMFVQGQTEGFVSRVAVVGAGERERQVVKLLELDERFELRPQPTEVAAAAEQLRDGTLDALVEFLPAGESGRALEANFAVRVTANNSKERSKEAGERISRVLTRFRDDWLRRDAEARGVTPAQWQIFTLETRNVATSKQMGQFILGLMLPIFFVIMVAVGCFYPAVDATAGERERNTWETTMTMAVPRGQVVLAKYLYVASFGCLAGVLNLVAMTLSMGMMLAPLLAKSGEQIEFHVPPAALPVMVLGAVLLAMFVAAGMMIFASFARTFKDGQSMITPFYMLILLPVMFLQVPGIEFTLPLAFIPIVNVTMMVREAITGTFHWLQIALTLVVGVGLITVCLALATFILRFEDVMIGSYGGSFNTFFKERVLKRGRRAEAEVSS